MEESDQPWHLHVCKICPYRTTSTLNMCKHVRVHRKKVVIDRFTCDWSALDKYECEACEFETDFKVNLKEHSRVLHESKGVNNAFGKILQCYQCNNCNFQTHSLFVITRHICVNCVSKNPVENYKWYEYKSGGLDWYRCKYCPHETIYRQVAKCHSAQHTDVAEINEFVVAQYLELEDIKWLKCERDTVRRWDQKDTKWWKCDQCPFEGKTKYSLKAHISARHRNAEEVNWFKCEQCDYRSQHKYRLKLHCLRRHVTPMLQCEQCPFKTTVEAALKQHIAMSHQNDAEMPEPEDVDWYEYKTLWGFKCFKCKQCSYEASRKINVQNHILSKHTNRKDVTEWFKCEYCPYKGIQRSNLRTHVRNMHSSPETQTWFQCKQCDYKSTKRAYLKNHILAKHTHPDDVVEWFRCNYCSYKSKFKAELDVHNLRKHTDPAVMDALKEKQKFI